MTDCIHPADAIFFNQYNGVIQCHRCGQKMPEPKRTNIWEDNMEEKSPAFEFRDLHDVISLVGLRYDETYLDQEVELLQPRLEALGYTDIQWRPGETDSFGPLTRVCRAKNSQGEVVWFVYG